MRWIFQVINVLGGLIPNKTDTDKYQAIFLRV